MLLLPRMANLQINSYYTSATPSTAALPHPHPSNPTLLPYPSFPILTHLFHIIPPLTNHPHQTPRTHKYRPRKWLPPPRCAKHKPLARKVRKRNHIRPNRQLVERRLVDVIRRVEADHACEEGPGAKGARRQPGYVRGLLDGRVDGGGVVDARGVGEGAVGLDGVKGGDEGDLGEMLVEEFDQEYLLRVSDRALLCGTGRTYEEEPFGEETLGWRDPGGECGCHCCNWCLGSGGIAIAGVEWLRVGDGVYRELQWLSLEMSREGRAPGFFLSDLFVYKVTTATT
jgi:hypothetical protein